MPSFATFTAALALAATVSASPVEKRKGFSIHQVERKVFAKNGPRTIVKTLRKYGKPVPEHILKAAEIGPSDVILSASSAQASNGSDPAVPGDVYDSLYLSPVSIGSAGTTVHLDFDTGSGDL